MPDDRDIQDTEPKNPSAPPAAMGHVSGVPVGVVGDETLARPKASDAASREPDPAEAEFERLTGHPVGANPTPTETGDHPKDRDPSA
jgi:hypothetical protein